MPLVSPPAATPPATFVLPSRRCSRRGRHLHRLRIRLRRSNGIGGVSLLRRHRRRAALALSRRFLLRRPVSRCFRGKFWHRRAETSERVRSFLPPLGAPEPLGSRREPANGLIRLPSFFRERRGLERHHGVASLLIKLRELADWIGARSRPADASLNLPPVCHCCGLYQSPRGCARKVGPRG
jgi:hypothetical protein